MKKIIYIFIFLLPIILLSCSGSNIEAELKSQLEIAEQKSEQEDTSTLTPKADTDAKTTSCQSSKSGDSVVDVKPICEVTPLINFINYTNYDNDYIYESIKLADSKMADRRASVIAFIYPVGKRTGKMSDNERFELHEVLMSTDEIDSMHQSIENWMKNDECLGRKKGLRNEHLDLYRYWLESGVDASTMQALCKETRVVAMGITKNMREREPLEEFQAFLIHEFYHAFQQDLEDEGNCRRSRDQEDSNRNWMVEGGAHYFSTMLVHEFNQIPNPHNTILMKAYDGYYNSSEKLDLYDVGPDISGAAALYLMINLEMLDEKRIMDARLFHNCDSEFSFDKNSSEIKHIKNSWYKIDEVSDNKFSFDSQAFKLK